MSRFDPVQLPLKVTKISLQKFGRCDAAISVIGGLTVDLDSVQT